MFWIKTFDQCVQKKRTVYSVIYLSIHLFILCSCIMTSWTNGPHVSFSAHRLLTVWTRNEQYTLWFIRRQQIQPKKKNEIDFTQSIEHTTHQILYSILNTIRMDKSYNIDTTTQMHILYIRYFIFIFSHDKCWMFECVPWLCVKCMYTMKPYPIEYEFIFTGLLRVLVLKV